MLQQPKVLESDGEDDRDGGDHDSSQVLMQPAAWLLPVFGHDIDDDVHRSGEQYEHYNVHDGSFRDDSPTVIKLRGDNVSKFTKDGC